jgi:2-succinyl-6-hydroxy-2,4-cyclohexadiene-1-carboxylate synthase
MYVGYSMGGRLCLHLALARPDLVEGLIVLGATAGIDDPGERAARREADEALAADLERGGLDAFLDRWLANPLFAGLDPASAGLDDRRRNTVRGLAQSLRRAGTGTQEPLWDRLGELTVPVLVVAGERDEKFAAHGRRMAGAIGTSATFATVPGAGHPAHLEQPAAFVAILLGWLDTQAL